ncbi:conserved Plasmodium protein, unknown function [Plasmodium knowlesi strain H]|uniref:Armadillo repeat protein n=3 Tax=Plasmodium knowlesi TaxID=5850 RepID=A0A5K1VUN9_PLAKH|nr:armadillo repeat protein, putative [Plasmodium knowlesi strain H]OTN67380.1 Uncharacterized protein PKNOH_S06425400 [Plasmodium knowlesi]CAA9987527.1 armadillo repeat protein, putative [Plasmodium knowlesi strain H]SBO23119.1 conserved Plasmodium protein, unknown function [Plasmodium knowlesi strain H]SBO23765.1 conserved Plasmodium protein, unknown function [Plasmodium knowlesi strain H]VVS77001.1 armadillo repeat protein, putative [Plasmodium knowlesi strain H]|eukprot:XP_002258528.1 hypothetical protein, conserved in Plasmodium species [Plasmodium knowlesi strain H]
MATSESCNANVLDAREAYLASSRENDVLREKLITCQREKQEDQENRTSMENKKNVNINNIHKFINKLKNASAAKLEERYLQTLLEDIKHLNISKYLSEIFNCLLDLVHDVNKYADVFVLVNFIRYVHEHYEHVSEHIDRIIFAKYFRLHEEDKNYFFLVFYELYNNISESSFSSNSTFCSSSRGSGPTSSVSISGPDGVANGGASDRENNIVQENEKPPVEGDGNSCDRLTRQLKELQTFQKAKAMAMKNLHTHMCKEGRETDPFVLEHDLFSNEGKETRGWKSNQSDQRAYIKEMLNDPNVLKKIKKQNKKRKVLLCMYLELVLNGICKNRDLLTYMFMNMSFFFTLNLDCQLTDKDRIALSLSVQEKRDVNSYTTKSDVLRSVKKYLSLSTVVTYDYVFTNAGTLFCDGFDSTVGLSGNTAKGSDNTSGDTISNTHSESNVASTTSTIALHLGEVKNHVLNFLHVFYYSSMVNLLIYLYGEHLINEYSIDRKNNPCQMEDYNFFSVYDMCQKLCSYLDLAVPSLDVIQIVGIQKLGMKDASVKHIKLFDKMKNNNRKDKDGSGDDSICFWANEEEKAFYTKFPNYSNINISLNEEEEDANAANVTSVGNASNAADPSNIANGSNPTDSGNPDNCTGLEATGRKDPKKGFQKYLEKLLHMNSEKELQDHVMTFLLNYNTKRKRKLVANNITHINQVVLNLIPFYCRYVAIINVYRKDMAVTIVEEVKRITEKLIKEKLPCQNKKNKCIKYICELAKFKLLDITYILDVLHLLSENFTSDHAELCLYILENCSLLLINNAKTHIRFINLLQKIKKMKSSKNLSTSFDLLFEECYIKIEQECDPKKKNLKKNKIKSKYSKENLKKKNFLKKLLFDDIEKISVEEISTHMRKFNWDDVFFTSLLRKYIFKFLMYMSIYQISNLASLLFYIAMHRPYFVTQIIDELYERIVHIIERNDFKKFSLLIQYAHLFSELFVYRMLSSSSVLDMLYFLVALSDTDMANFHHVANIHRLFHENRLAALEERNNPVENKPENGTSKNGDHFSFDNYANPAHKFLFINKRSPVFRNLLQDPDCSSFINIKMICIIVERCGKYFQNAPLLKFKLTKFFLIFIRFLRVQEPLPVYITHLTNNIVDMFCKDMLVLTTAKQVDKYLLKLLRCEYKVYLSITSRGVDAMGGIHAEQRNSSLFVTEEELTFRLDPEDATPEQHKDIGRGKLKGNTRRVEVGYPHGGRSGPQRKTGEYNYGVAYRDRYGGSLPGTQVKSITTEDNVSKKDLQDSHVKQEDATANEDIDKEINAIIKSSILENRSCQSRRDAPQNIKNATLYGKLLGRVGKPVGVKCVK